jgi:hypothetical protein
MTYPTEEMSDKHDYDLAGAYNQGSEGDFGPILIHDLQFECISELSLCRKGFGFECG